MNSKGFTLVELMVVVVIIGILVAIIIPIYGSVQDNAAKRTHESNLRAIDEAIGLYTAQKGYGPATNTGIDLEVGVGSGVAAIDKLVNEGFLNERPVLPSRVSQNSEWLSPPYDLLVSNLFQQQFNVETVYYEVYENADGIQRSFPTLIDGDYRGGEEPEGNVVTDFLIIYFYNNIVGN